MTPIDLSTEKIAGKTIVFTSDAEDIGQAKAICLASEGARMLVTDIDSSPLRCQRPGMCGPRSDVRIVCKLSLTDLRTSDR